MGEAVHMLGTGNIREISVPATHFCCKPTTALKINKVFKKKQNYASPPSPTKKSLRFDSLDYH